MAHETPLRLHNSEGASPARSNAGRLHCWRREIATASNIVARPQLATKTSVSQRGFEGRPAIAFCELHPHQYDPRSLAGRP
eukprot:5226764-Pyramimonas_sp.AAC.1